MPVVFDGFKNQLFAIIAPLPFVPIKTCELPIVEALLSPVIVEAAEPPTVKVDTPSKVRPEYPTPVLVPVKTRTWEAVPVAEKEPPPEPQVEVEIKPVVPIIKHGDPVELSALMNRLFTTVEVGTAYANSANPMLSNVRSKVSFFMESSKL